MEIKSVTWSKVSHGLFDYESSSFVIKKAHIQNSSYIYRKGDFFVFLKNLYLNIFFKENEISVEENMFDPKSNFTFLTKINYNDEKSRKISFFEYII